MTVRIGHASISENGTINGAKGDSTGKEVCTRTWYSKPWDFMAIHPDADVRERHAQAIEDACANDNIGYGQSDRNSAHTEAKKVEYVISKIKTKCNTDCSALQNLAAVVAGTPNVTYGTNGWTTSTMKSVLKSAGYKIIEDKAYLTSADYCVRGAIYVKAGSHTVGGLDNGTNYEKTLEKAGISANTSTNIKSETIKTLEVDGKWGTETTKRAQEIFGETVDGVVSNQLSAYKSENPGLVSGFDWTGNPTDSGSKLIKAIQKKVGATQDGHIGTQTIKAMQKWLGTTQDGKVSNPSLMVKAFQKWLNEQ